jgi:hypothetical protein
MSSAGPEYGRAITEHSEPLQRLGQPLQEHVKSCVSLQVHVGYPVPSTPPTWVTRGLHPGNVAGAFFVPYDQPECKSLAPTPLSHYYNACSLSQCCLELYAYAISTLHREQYETTVEGLFPTTRRKSSHLNQVQHNCLTTNCH